MGGLNRQDQQWIGSSSHLYTLLSFFQRIISHNRRILFILLYPHLQFGFIVWAICFFGTEKISISRCKPRRIYFVKWENKTCFFFSGGSFGVNITTTHTGHESLDTQHTHTHSERERAWQRAVGSTRTTARSHGASRHRKHSLDPQVNMNLTWAYNSFFFRIRNLGGGNACF